MSGGSFNVDFRRLPQFVEAMRDAPKVLDKEMFTAARRISKRGEALSQKYVSRDTGTTAGSIYSEATQIGDSVQAVWGASSDAAWHMDHGRKAGSKMPPEGVLLPWMSAHSIPESAEFAVRKKIARDGIPARPFVSRAHKELKAAGVYVKEFGDAVKRTLAKFRGAA